MAIVHRAPAMAKATLLLVAFSCFLAATTAVNITGPGTAHVEENSPTGTLVATFIVAAGGSPSWSLSGTFSSDFAIDQAGRLTVQNPPDRETRPTYALTVTATDGSDSGTKLVNVVVLDVNDNPPTFENAPTTNVSLTLSESEPVNTVIYTVFASDPDQGTSGNFHFVLIDPDGLFLIGYLTGNIELHQSLDHESNTQHTLTVFIVDEGSPPLTTTVYITVNVTNTADAAPVFTNKFYYATVPEGVYSELSPASLTTIHADDAESDPMAVIKYSIVSNGQPWINQFSVNEDTGNVQVSGTLDFETLSRYVVPVQAREYHPGGLQPIDAPPASATVVVSVTDINDNPPVFFVDHYTGVVPEDASIGHIVIASVAAFDRDQGSNGEFVFQIRDRSISVGDAFNINNDTGVIFVTGALDFETKPTFEFTIEAVDIVQNPLTGKAAVSIQVQNVNDHPPFFAIANFSFTIPENEPSTTFTQAMQAMDEDNIALVYTLAGQGSGTKFQLSTSGNQAFLTTTGPLDREETESYHMLILASDGGINSLSATANIFVTVEDRNDNPPEFELSSYTVDVIEETTYLSNCFSVHAVDDEDSPGPNTNVIYSFTVSASSPNMNTTRAEEHFAVDSLTGQFSCSPINHEENFHTITIQAIATDQGTNPGPQNSTVLVQITVEDINEHIPQFSSPTYTSMILETHSVNTPIGLTLQATELGDMGLSHTITYTITSGNIGGAFAINETSGMISLANPVDYETLTPDNNPIAFTVRAADQPDSMGTIRSSFATVMVTIEDVNDNTPTFPGPVSFTVSEGANPGVIYTFEATDNDGPSDGVVHYTFATPPSYGTYTLGLTSGALTMTTPPDREALPPGNMFTFTVTARDNPTDPSTAKSSSVNVTITVTDINDNIPAFNASSFTIEVAENSPEGTPLLSMPADDPDEGVNGEVDYRIDSVSPPEGVTKFTIDSAGVLRAGSGGFDYEDTQGRTFTVVVNARDRGTVPQQQTGTATVTVDITDVNDETPVFEMPSYSIIINETIAGSPSSSNINISSVAATDADEPSTAASSITYRIDDPRARGWFGVDPTSGDIYVIAGQEVDREDEANVIDSLGRAVVTFDITAVDGGTPSLTGTAEVTVYIRDLNDNSPVFNPASISTGIPESATPGTLVEVVTASDADYGSNAQLTYRKTSGDTSNLFNITEPSSGRIVVSGFLDKEAGTPGMPHIITFIITASDNAGNTGTIQVMVEITDSNDNSPVFLPTFYQVSLSENTTFDQPVEFVFATDADTGTNGEITYAIVGGNINDAFYIKSPTLQGNIRVNNSLVIDREAIPFYRLIVTATDNAFPASYRRTAVAEVVVLITDVNDNSPQFLFQMYTGTVAESSPIDTTVVVSPALLATDNDVGVNAQITYDIPPGDEFTINPQTGAITTSISTLDREERDFYNITVQARDGGGRVGTAMLSITITDINDKRPTFLADTQMLNLDRTLMENFTVGDHIVDVIATDDDIGVNAQLTYTVTNGDGYFQINSSGAITLAQSMLPEEGLGPFELTVTATDGGIPAMSNSFEVDITVTDVNDNAPVITQAPQMVHVAEDFTVGNIILDALLTMPIQATDRDQGTNAEIEFILDPLSSFFGIDFVNGQVQINLTAPLDRETVAQHTISVVARDKGTPQLSSTPSVITFIVDDVNDNPPIFSQDQYAANVSEFTGPGVPVLLLLASDNDTGINAEIRFELMAPTPSGELFRVDAVTGLVITNMLLDQTQADVCYSLTVLAKDQGVPQNTDTATVMICITDQNQSPQFSQAFYTFNISENLPAGTVVGTVVADDPDPVMNENSVIAFTLVTNPADTGLFHINSTTGVITLLNPLDREDQSIHVLTVIAQDMGNTIFQHANYTTVVVDVGDVNDNNPLFEFNTFSVTYSIREDISRNTTIATIGATDADIFPNNRIVFDILSDPRTLFKIDHETGLLQTEAGHGPDGFDYESFTQYSIVVIVYNGAEARHRNSTVTITFNLIDVNDETPFFTVVPPSVCVNESAPAGHVVVTIAADDRDNGLNGKPLFSIVDDGGNIGEAFSIGALSGNLMVLNPLDYDAHTRNYTLTITVSDLGVPPLSTSTAITVCVLDVNDNAPMFATPSISVSVQENSPRGYPVYQFVITDPDDAPYNASELSIIAGNDAGGFYINTSTNTLHVNNSGLLDFESPVKSYTLTVRAVDSLPGVNGEELDNTASITIAITDVNDNSPMFDEALYNVSLLETTAMGTIIERVIATDLDSGSNAELVYDFLNGNIDDTFAINSEDGTITLAKTLDYDSGQVNYSLIIIARNLDRNGTAMMFVEVFDVNDHAPAFESPSQPSYPLTIYENATAGDVVFIVRAVDGDGGTVTYSFSNDQQEVGPFIINATTGVIILTQTLDRETQQSTEFTVVARDSGNLTSNVHFLVTIGDINDHVPFFPPLQTSHRVLEDAPTGPDNPFFTVAGRDTDDSDASNLFYHLVVGGYALPNECGDVFCVGLTSAQLYFNRSLDRETQDAYSITVVVSNSPSLPTDKTVAALGLTTITISVTVLDVNDNSPQFQEFTTRAGVAEDAEFGITVVTVVATDRDIGTHGVVWYELRTGGNPFTIGRQTGDLNTAGVFRGLAGIQYSLSVEAYDNERMEPSLTNETTISVWVYNHLRHIIIFTVNRTMDVVQADQERYIRGLQNITGGEVIITSLRVETSDAGSITRSGSDMLFIVIDSTGTLVENSLAILRVEQNFGQVISNFGNEDPKFRVPIDISQSQYPVWLWIIIAVLAALILLLCCAFCIFLIVEKRVNRKLRDDALESSYTSISQEHVTANPMWAPPPPLPDDDISISTVGTKQTLEKPNPVYEEQEVVMELFTDEDNEEPPFGSTEHLLAPGYRDSIDTHDLLAEAVGLPTDGMDDEEELTSEI